MTHKPRHSGGTPGASGPPGRNYPVSKPSPAPPGERGGGGYVAPSEPKQSVKSLMTSDKAYKVDTPKKETKTFDDSSREKGLMYSQTIGSKKLGRHRKKQVLNLLQTGGSEKDIKAKIKEKNLSGAVGSLMSKIPSKPSDQKTSISREIMKKIGIPLKWKTALYDTLIGTHTPLVPKFGLLSSLFSSGDATKRKTTYKPLTIDDFSEYEIISLRDQAINAIKNHAKETGIVKKGKLNEATQIVFTVGGTDNLFKTLNKATAYIDENNNVRILDTYDFEEKKFTTHGITIKQPFRNTYVKFKPKNYAQAISAIFLATAQGNPPSKGDLISTFAVLEASAEKHLPMLNTEKRKLEEQTGQKIMMDLNLGQIQ